MLIVLTSEQTEQTLIQLTEMCRDNFYLLKGQSSYNTESSRYAI